MLLGGNCKSGVVLTIQPGVTVRFLSNGFLNVQRKFSCSGTPTQPITFTGATATPGSWAGIQAYGPPPNPPALINMDYVTIEYGGLSGTSTRATLCRSRRDHDDSQPGPLQPFERHLRDT